MAQAPGGDDNGGDEEPHVWGSLNTKQQRSSHELKMAKKRLRKADIDEREHIIIDEMVAALEHEQVTNERFGDARLALHIDRYRLIAECKPGVLAQAVHGDTDSGSEAITEIKRWQRDERGNADNTIGDWLQTIKHLGEYLFDEIPERFDELNPRSYMDDDPTPAATNIVTWDEAVQMAETREHLRDQAIILVQWPAGTRPECEFWELQFKHLEDMGTYYKLSVPTPAKTGKRTVYLFAGSAILRKWHQKEHPAHKECEDGPGPETYLWSYLGSNQPLGYSQIKRIFRQAGQDAGIEKTHSAQHFRRSRASVLASRKTINHLDLHNLFGWTRNSDAPKHYIAEFSGETKKHVAEADGHIEEFEDPDPIAPHPCPNCEQWTERGMSECIHCEHELDEYEPSDERVAVDPVHGDADLMTMILEDDVTADDLRSVQKLEGVIKKRSQFFEQLDQLIDLARRDEQGQFQLERAMPVLMILVAMLVLLL